MSFLRGPDEFNLREWPLTDVRTCVAGALLYLVVIFGLQQLLRSRAPVEEGLRVVVDNLKWTFAAHNAILSLGSFVMLIGVSYNVIDGVSVCTCAVTSCTLSALQPVQSIQRFFIRTVL
jgi:hypothetical protein